MSKNGRHPNRYELSKYPITDGLKDEIQAVPVKPIVAGSGHGGTGYKKGWIDGMKNARINPSEVGGYIGHAIDYLLNRANGYVKYDVSQIMVNLLEPNCRLDAHRDGHCIDYRFHLPIITNPNVFWWDEITSQNLNFEEGYWYGPVPYSGVLHSMRNEGLESRYHLVVDLTPPK